MKYCTSCGAEAAENASFCSNCGARLNASAPQYNGTTAGEQYYGQPRYGDINRQYSGQSVNTQPADGKTVYAVVGFFFPIVGIILWLLLKGDREGDARKAGKGALISIILRIIVSIACVVLFFVLAANGIVDVVQESSFGGFDFGGFNLIMLYALKIYN